MRSTRYSEYGQAFELEVNDDEEVEVKPLVTTRSPELSPCDLERTRSRPPRLVRRKSLAEVFLRWCLVAGLNVGTIGFVVLSSYFIIVNGAHLLFPQSSNLAPRLAPKVKTVPQSMPMVVARPTVQPIPGLLENVVDPGQIDGVDMPKSLQGFNPSPDIPKASAKASFNGETEEPGDGSKTIDLDIDQVSPSEPYTRAWFINCRTKVRRLNAQIKGSVPGDTQAALIEERSQLIKAYNSRMTDRLSKVYGILRNLKV